MPPWGSITDTLYFNLTEGDYQITASSQLPPVSAQASFSVRKGNRVEMAVSAGAQADGLIPVPVNLTNQGYNSLAGSIQLSAISAQGATVWQGSENVYLPCTLPPTPNPLSLNVNPAAMGPGNYTLKVKVLSSSNQQLAVSNQQLTINGPAFQISQLPASQTFYAGEEASFTFRIKNTGDQEGAVEFHLKAYDLIDLTRTEWVKAGEEKDLPFSFMLPEDLEEKDYFVDYEMKGSGVQGLEGSRGQVKYHLAGIRLNVSGVLDKPYYREGEVAHLSISVSSLSPLTSALSLFARVNYPGYESRESFLLSGSQIMSFHIPLAAITGEKLFFGVYHESGRSIHLNSLYIHKADDVLTLITDKQVYQPGEVVSVSASGSGNIKGNLTLTAPAYEETFSFSGTATRSFILPSTMTAGTYYVSYQLSAASGQSYTGSHPFDVAGIQVKVKEATLDKAKYASSDTIKLSLVIESNQNLAATLKTWVMDPEKNYAAPGTQAVNLSSPVPLLTTLTLPFTTNKLGIHRIVYGIYSGDLLLCSGSEAFDLGEAVILGLKTDQVDYPTGQEGVGISLSLYGTLSANLEFFLDDKIAGGGMVSLSGFANIQESIPGVSPGRHTLKARVISGGLTSTKETSFLYGSALPDLTVRVSRDQNIIDGVMKITVMVTNQGKTSSTPTTMGLYDGEDLLATFPVGELQPGQSQSYTYSLNVLGRAGANTLRAAIDLSNGVYEFSKANNEANISFPVPDLNLAISLEKETYSLGDPIVITGRITNLSKTQLTGIILTTAVTDALNLPVFGSSQTISSIDGLGTKTIPVSWPTSINLSEGIYTISQMLEGKGISIQRSVTLKLDKDFTVASDQTSEKVEIGEAVEYRLILTSLRGFDGEVSLSIQGCPAGFTASFSLNPVSLAGGQAQAIFKMIPTGQVRSGSYPMKVYAAGGGRSHEVMLSLELTDFQIAVLPGAQRIRQLEGATYKISLTPLSGFDSQISLEVTGVPLGMRTSVEASQVAILRDIRLHLSTSKWLLPGAYPLTLTAKGRAVHHEAVAMLVVDKNPLLTPGIITAPGLKNKLIIRSFQIDGVLMSQFRALDGKGRVNIAAGDVDGDGIDEVIMGAESESSRSPALVGVFKRDGTPVAAMELEPEGHKTRVAVAVGDVDGDWVEEVAVSSYPYSPEEEGEEEDDGQHKDSREDWREIKNHHHQRVQGVVRVYKVVGGKFIDTGLGLFPYEGEGYRGAPNIAFGDVDGDGVPELITAPGPDPMAPAHIKVFKIATKGEMGRWKVGSQLADLLISFEGKKEHRKGHEDKDGSFRYPDGYGANIAAGDLDGDGRAEIIVGAGPDPRKNGRVMVLFNRNGGYPAESIAAHEATHFGVSVASEDIDGDGLAEILTGLGPDPRNKSMVRIFRRDGTTLGEFQAYPDNMRYGVKVSKGAVGE
ncbi:MAG: CARDB domain-containing protein [Thermodesulfobacteriota bacterium]